VTATARARQADRRYYGVYSAVVAAVNDPAKQGRVRLRMAWFDANFVSDWCRVCYHHAGSGFGSLTVPELDTEVAVCFMHGDLRFPLVLGGMYSNDVLPPSFRADDHDQKVIFTRGGHRVILDDTRGKETIVVLAAGGKQRLELSTADGAVRVSSEGGTVEVNAAGGKIVLKAADVEIQADQSLTLKAGGPVKVQGATIDLN
jgi:uncharacterized protein involved in type VI secretion and phage assembly